MAEAAPAETKSSSERQDRAPARRPAALAKKKEAGYAADEEADQSIAQQPIAVRKQFGALAVFAPAVKTDASGRASVAVKVPDNLTRYRVMVAAVAGEKQFGAGESSITARMPLMVRPSPPRFLNFGDRFELPVVLQNQTDRAMAVKLAVRATNAALTAGSGRQVTVPANDRVEVRLPAAAEMAGTARFQIAAASGRLTDAAEFALPVWTPATSEAFAVYGEIDKGAIRQKISMPKNAVTEFGGLEVSTSSTQLQALTDAVLYLVAYPYECAEQVSSRILAVAALRDVLSAFEAEGLPKPKELERAVARDIDKLRALQNGDGGFAFWVRGHESWPYLSIHGGHALIRAKEKGYDVPADMIERNKGYLRVIEQHLPWYYPPDVKRTLRAYALYVRKRMGDRDIAEAHRILREAGGADKLPLEAVGWLYATMTGDSGSADQLRAIRRLLDNRASETAATAHFTTGYKDGGYLLLHSDRRADGILLEALIDDQPRSDLIPKIVRGLLAHRVRGHWTNTQENAFVLLAMDRYFRVYEKVTPDFVARAWLGDGYAGEHRFAGRQTDQHRVDIPMSYLARMRGGAQDLILQKDGKGRLYYRIGMTYAPTSLWLAPEDHGFAVERVYEPVDNPKDVVTSQGRHLEDPRRRPGPRPPDHGRRGPPLPRRPGRSAARRPRADEPRPRRHRSHPARPQGARQRRLVVVDPHLVRAPEHARRASRGLRLAAVGGRARVHLRRPRHHPGHASSSPPLAPRRCTSPRPSAAPLPTASSSSRRMTAQRPVYRASFLACAMLWSALCASCGSRAPRGAPGTEAPTPADRALVQLEDTPPGLAVRLSEGKAGAPRGERVKRARAAVLPEAAAQSLLARMPALVADGQDTRSFALREKSQPPPQTGNVIKGTFPPAGAGRKPPAARVDGTELEVLRFTPEGEVPLAPHLSIAFNQPMVAITSHADTVAEGVPVKLTPQPPGKWRWIGSRTLLFDPEVRFPAATKYAVEIAAGTRSASGAVLRKAVRFTFATPAPVLSQMWPPSGPPQRRDALMFAAFDQKIDAEAVLATIKLKTDGGVTRVRRATPEEIAEEPEVRRLIEAEDEAEHQGRYVAFKPVALLPGDSAIQVAVGPDTPSAEGPRRTTSSQGWSFHTFGPLKVVRAGTVRRDRPARRARRSRSSSPTRSTRRASTRPPCASNRSCPGSRPPWCRSAWSSAAPPRPARATR